MNQLSPGLIEIQAWFGSAGVGGSVPDPFHEPWYAHRFRNSKTSRPMLKLASHIYSALEDLEGKARDPELPMHVRESATRSAEMHRRLCAWIADRMLMTPALTKSEAHALWLAYIAAETYRRNDLDLLGQSARVGYKLLVKSGRKKTPPIHELVVELARVRAKDPDLSESAALLELARRHGVSRCTILRRLRRMS